MAVVVDGGPLVHTAQLLPVGADGKLPGEKDASAQIRRVLEELDRVLKVAQSDRERLVKLNVNVRDAGVIAEVHRLLAESIRSPLKPAVTFVEGPLRDPDALVGIDAVARSGLAGESGVVRRLQAPGLGGAAGSRLAVLPSGPCVYLAGQAEKGDLATATRKTLLSLRETLTFLGLNETHVVQLKAFMRPANQAGVVEKEIASHFGEGAVPPVVFVEWVSPLPIEIELIAAVPTGTGQQAERIEFLTPPGAQASPVYSRVARIGAVRRVYVSGLVSSTPGSGAVQMQDIFRTLDRLLTQSGSDLRHLAKATYYVTDEDASRQLNEVRLKHFDPKRPPAASKATVSGVGRAGRTVSLDMIAVESK
jgi:enamine deaminase RidA (YjgF/YER057c/UK114 family)